MCGTRTSASTACARSGGSCSGRLRGRALHGRAADAGDGSQGAIRGKPVRTTISDKAAPCPLDQVNRQFTRRRRTGSGSPTSPTWPPGPASSTSPSSSTPSRGDRRLAGQQDRACRLRPRRPGTGAPRRRPAAAAASFTTAIGAPSTFRSATPSASPRPASSLRSAASATPTTTPSPKRHRPLQGRGHPSARPLAQLRGRRVRHPRVGGLVQQSPAAGAHRLHAAGRSRGTLLRHAERHSHGGVTQTKRPPAKPARLLIRGSCAPYPTKG